MKESQLVRDRLENRDRVLRLNGLENQRDKETDGEALQSVVVFKCDQ